MSRAGLSPSDAEGARRALRALASWDGALPPTSESAAIYQLMHAALVRNLIAAGVRAKVAGAIPSALLAADSVMGGTGGTVLDALVCGQSADGVTKPTE